MRCWVIGLIAALFCLEEGALRAQDLALQGPELFRLPEEVAADAPQPAEQAPDAEKPATEETPPLDVVAEEIETPSPSDESSDIVSPSSSQTWIPRIAMWEPDFWDPWEGNVELGLSGTEGNSETFNVRVGMTAKHKTDWLVKTVQITSIQKSAYGVTTANTALLDARLDWPLTNSRWSYFIHSLLEYDEFKPFDARISADSGLGYEFIQNDNTNLVGSTGFALSHEIGGADDDVVPEWLFGLKFKHKFNDHHSISFQTDYYPALENFGDFRLNSQASWEIVLSKDWGLSLKLSAIDRYDSTPQGAKPNDLDYSTLLLWSF